MSEEKQPLSPTPEESDRRGGYHPPEADPPAQQPEPEKKPEHSHKHRQKSVFQYITILFAAAFVLLLYTFMMERRQNDILQQQSNDKLNQLRHVRFLRDAEGLAAHMAKHAAILRPKFELVNAKLQEGLDEVGGCSWSNPRGGYFVSFDAPQGCAKRVVTLAKEAGVTMTGAGATYPYKQDPNDSNIRIAPTLPPLEELDEAMDVFTVCVKLAYVEKLLG